MRKILTVLQSSRCAVPCIRWYTDRLVECSERWGGVPRDQGDFPIPPSLVECATTGFCFTDGSRLSPGKGLKKKKSPKKGDQYIVCDTSHGYSDNFELEWYSLYRTLSEKQRVFDPAEVRRLKGYPGLQSARTPIFPSPLTFLVFLELVWNCLLWKKKHGKNI